MDRFIVLYQVLLSYNQAHLKSNMDRFIGAIQRRILDIDINLKSNMDRFIACKVAVIYHLNAI